MEFIESLILKYPVLSQVLVVVGSLRLILKPIFSAINTYIVESPSKKDDAILNKIKEHKIAKVVIYCIDWIASIKIKK